MDNWLKEWGEFAENIDQEIFKWIKEGFSIYKDEAINLNKQQLSAGMDSTSKNLSPYSKPYERVRRKYGRPTSPKDLNLTGGHYKGFYGLALDSYFEQGSKDLKADILEHNYPNIYGIPTEQLDSFLETFIWPHCAKRLTELAGRI
jgi:hypothetical protein